MRGREAHSSLTPDGVNAIEFAARLVAFIRQTADRLSREETRDARFAVPYTTLQTGVIKGGIAVNVVPRDCEFTFEMRNLPATSTDEVTRAIVEYAERELVPEMRRVTNDAGIAFERRHGPAGVRYRARSSARTVGTTGRKHHASKRRRSRLRDRGQHVFAKAGIPTVVIGPGSIDQAHKPDEYISYDQVAACEAFFDRIVAQPMSSEHQR